MFACRLLATLFVSLGLLACGSSNEPPPEPMPVKDTFAGDLVGTMDKARGVEETTLQHKDDIDEALDAAESDH